MNRLPLQHPQDWPCPRTDPHPSHPVGEFQQDRCPGITDTRYGALDRLDGLPRRVDADATRIITDAEGFALADPDPEPEPTPELVADIVNDALSLVDSLVDLLPALIRAAPDDKREALTFASVKVCAAWAELSRAKEAL